MTIGNVPETLDWDHFTDLYGEKPVSNQYKKKWDNRAVSHGGGNAPGSKKEVIELRLHIVNKYGQGLYWKEYFFESYNALQRTLKTYGLTQLDYPAFMLWFNDTQDKCLVKKEDHTIFTYTLLDSIFEAPVRKILQSETSDDIILPRGEQNK